MIKKHKRIIKLVKLINNIFGNNTLLINDHWEGDLCAVSFQKGNKLIYISTIGCKNDHYFYECELLIDNPDEIYITQNSEDNVPKEKLLEVMSKFFSIEKLC